MALIAALAFGIIPPAKSLEIAASSSTQIEFINEFSSGQLRKMPDTSVENITTSAFKAPPIAPAIRSAFMFSPTPSCVTAIGETTGVIPFSKKSFNTDTSILEISPTSPSSGLRTSPLIKFPSPAEIPMALMP